MYSWHTFCFYPSTMMGLCWTILFAALFFVICHISLRILVHQYSYARQMLSEMQRMRQLQSSFPSLLLNLASFLKSGHALSQALSHISQSQEGQALRKLLIVSDSSLPLRSDFRPFIQYLQKICQMGQTSGIPLSALFKRIAHIARSQHQLQQKMNLLTLPLRAQIFIALLLPWGVTLLFWLMDPALIEETLQNPTGQAAFLCAICFEITALIWMRRLMRS